VDIATQLGGLDAVRSGGEAKAAVELLCRCTPPWTVLVSDVFTVG
jgi:hypothetical protein